MENQGNSAPHSAVRTPNSPPALVEEARRYLVGGVNSPVRAFHHVGGTPLILTHGRGAQVRSHQGKRLVDFIMGWGALILGHNHPAVMRALTRGVDEGVLMGLTHPAEVELAERIARAVPSVEQVRFTVSGTEACLTAIKLARAVTGRTKILTFDGCYHGHGESVIARASAGIPRQLAEHTLSVPYNDPAAVEQVLERHGKDLAAVIIEPVAANMGVVAPVSGYLARVRALTARAGSVLIFDEVVTGFRLGLGGAQGAFGVMPDLTTFGKIVGGGLPVGALGGPRRLMQRLAPVGDVYHGGTFAGHPLSMAAGIATLDTLAAHPPYERLDALSRRLAEGLAELGRQLEVPVQVNRVGSMMTLFFSDAPVRNEAGAKQSRRDRFAQWARALRDQGILVAPSPFEALFVSSAHRARDIDALLRASRAAFAAMGRSG